MLPVLGPREATGDGPVAWPTAVAIMEPESNASIEQTPTIVAVFGHTWSRFTRLLRWRLGVCTTRARFRERLSTGLPPVRDPERLVALPEPRSYPSVRCRLAPLLPPNSTGSAFFAGACTSHRLPASRRTPSFARARVGLTVPPPPAIAVRPPPAPSSRCSAAAPARGS